MVHDNIIIFGAGASFDAGIPLLNNFVDTMWGYAIRGRSPNSVISPEDKKLLEQADAIRVGLERYNSRANFNMRNLEDVLSLLSFESLAGGEALEKYQTWVRAITRTVELSTSHSYGIDAGLLCEFLNQSLRFLGNEARFVIIDNFFALPEPRKPIMK